MKRILCLLASFVALVTSGLNALHAASSPAAALPVISITQVAVKNSAIYATQIAAVNAMVKTKLGVDPLFRVYLGDAAGPDSGAVFAVSRADTFAVLTKSIRAYQTEPELANLRMGLDAVRELGPRTLLKAARFDGGYPNAWLYNTYASVTDEAAYLKALDELTGLLKSHGFDDIRLNVYRVIAGRSDYTHLVSFNLSSSERLGVFLDTLASETWVAEWLASSAKLRTVVRNGTYNEITR